MSANNNGGSQNQQNPNEQKRKKQLIVVFILVAVVISGLLAALFLVGNDQQDNPEASKTVELTVPGDMNAQDAWRAEQAAQDFDNSSKISQLETTLQQQEAKQEELTKTIQELNRKLDRAENNAAIQGASYSTPSTPATAPEKTYPTVSNATPPMRQGLHGNSILPDPDSPIDPNVPVIGATASVPRKSMEIIDFNKADNADNASATEQPLVTSAGSAVKPVQAAEKLKGATFIPEGSFVRVLMINGVDAPTGGQAQQDPLPIAFQTVDPINMPNGYKLNIKGCRFLGYAWGSLSTERMMARIETGNCIINGQTVRVDLKGHVMGEDGKPGVRGRVVSKQGQALANAALASALEAIGNLYQNTAGTTTTSALGVTRTVSNEDIKNAAIGGGVAGGAEKLSDFYLQRANEMFPIIESDAGRIVEILVTKGVEVTGLENLGSNSIVRKPTTRKLKDE